MDGQSLEPDGKRSPDQLRAKASVFEVNQGQLISYVPGRGYKASGRALEKRFPAESGSPGRPLSAERQPEPDRTGIGLCFARLLSAT